MEKSSYPSICVMLIQPRAMNRTGKLIQVQRNFLHFFVKGDFQEYKFLM